MRRMRKLKVWGGSKYGKRRYIVCASTIKEALNLTDISYSYFHNYWSETGNEEELSIANEIGVWECPDRKNNFKFVKINQ